MMMGLKEGQEKMSKSDPDSAIFMEDEVADVQRKVKKAYCPEKIVLNNPIMDYCRYIVFEKFERFVITRKPEYGGDQVYTAYADLEKDYIEGNVHPGDLKPAVAAAINVVLQPVRDHFLQDPYAKKLLE